MNMQERDSRLSPIEPQYVLFTINGFTVEVCRSIESLEKAFHLRYRAFKAIDVIDANDEEMLYDELDFMPHTFTHLVWYDNKPVATIRSCIYSDQYDWQKTEDINCFSKDITQKLGTQTRILESNRYAVDPDFQGRNSLFAQMLLFRVHALCSAAHECSHIITAVRIKHIPFYQRFLGFEQISKPKRTIEWIDAEVALLAVSREKSYEIALKRGVPEITPHDIANYAICAGIYQKGNDLAA